MRLDWGKDPGIANFQVGKYDPVDLALRQSTFIYRDWLHPRADPKGEHVMRVMVIVKATKDSEAGVLPSKELIEAMGKYNEQLVKAGIMLAGDGLKPSSKGKRVRFSGDKRTVIDGPFTETKELIAGYWIWQVRSMEEAVEWLKRCPNPMPGESDVEIRPFFEAADFGENLTPEAQEREKRLREEIAGKRSA